MADVFQLAERTALPDQPAPDTGSESTISPPPPQPATGGARVFDIAENAPQNYVKDYLKESVGKGRQWGDVENRLKELGFDPGKIKDSYQIESAKLKALRPQEKGLVEKAVDVVGSPFGYETTAGPETTLQKFKRSYMPFGDFLGTNGNTAYSAAQFNVKSGKAKQEDYDTIARYETIQGLDEKVAKTFEGKLAGTVGDISKIVGETAVGSGLVKGAGGLTGIGQAEKVTRLGRFGQFAGTQAATLPFVPSMYIPMAQQNNIAQGRAANDWRGYPTAVGYGYANLLVLGQLQGNVGGNVVSQALKKGALGTAELTGVDVAAGLADEALPKSFQVGTKYGTLGQLARGSGFNLGGKANPGDLRQGLEHATVQVLTFSALAAMHGRSPQLITDAFKGEVNQLHDAGLSEKAAGEVLKSRIIDPIESILRDPTITREKAIDQLGDAYHNNPVVKSFVDGLPPKQQVAQPQPPTAPGGETFQPPGADTKPHEAAGIVTSQFGPKESEKFASIAESMGGKNPEEIRLTLMREGFNQLALNELHFAAEAISSSGPAVAEATRLNVKRNKAQADYEATPEGQKAKRHSELKANVEGAQRKIESSKTAISQLGKPYRKKWRDAFGNEVMKDVVDSPEAIARKRAYHESEIAKSEAEITSARAELGETFQPPEVTLPAIPAVRSPLEVLGERGIRELAKQFGLSAKGDIQKILDRINTSPTGKTVLESRLRASEKPTAPQIAPDASKTVEVTNPPEVKPTSPEPVNAHTPFDVQAHHRDALMADHLGVPVDELPDTAKSHDTAPAGERFHIFNYLDPSKSVDTAIAALDTRIPTSKVMQTWHDAENAKGQQKPGTATVVMDTREFDGVVQGRTGIDNLKHPLNALPYDPALKKVIYRGGESEPGYAKLKAALDDVNVRRAERDLKPVALEATEKGETFQPPAPSRLEQIRAKQQGKTTPAPAAPEPVLSRGEWHRLAEDSMHEAGILPKEAAGLFAELHAREAKDGWPAARDWLEKRVGSKIREMAANDAEGDALHEQLLAAHPYDSIPEVLRSQLDPLIDEMSRAKGFPRDAFESSARVAYGMDGETGVAALAELWQNRLKPFKPKSEAELQAEQDKLQKEEEAYAKLTGLAPSSTRLVGAPAGRPLAGGLGYADAFLARLARERAIRRGVQVADEVTNPPRKGGKRKKAPVTAGEEPGNRPAQDQETPRPGPEAQTGQTGSAVASHDQIHTAIRDEITGLIDGGNAPKGTNEVAQTIRDRLRGKFDPAAVDKVMDGLIAEGTLGQMWQGAELLKQARDQGANVNDPNWFIRNSQPDVAKGWKNEDVFTYKGQRLTLSTELTERRKNGKKEGNVIGRDKDGNPVAIPLAELPQHTVSGPLKRDETFHPVDAAGLESNPNADKELLTGLKDSAPASARDYLESAAWNTPSEKTNLSPADRRHASVERIATEWGNATMAGDTVAANYLRSLMLKFGGTVYGAKAGSSVSFDPARYGGPKGEPLARSVGAKVRVVREPVVSTSFDGREGLALKGIVEPIDRFAGAKQKALVEGPKERAQRANETKWVADENALREQGVVTLAEEVRTQYGGIDPDDFRKNHGEGEYQKAQESYGNSMFSGKGGKGTAKIEDIMAQMKENGQLGNRDLSPEQFLELVGKHVPVEDAGGKGYETAQQRDAHRQASQDIRDRFLAENPDATPAEVEKAVKEGLADQIKNPWQPPERIPFHTGGKPPKGETFQPSNGVEPSSKPVKAPTPYELAATIDSVLGVTNYTEGTTPYGNPAAVAVLKAGEAQPQAVVTQKMFAGEPAVRLEEAGHVLAARYKLELAPAALPPDVAQGFLEFWGKKGEAQSRLSTLEGFSQWLIERTAGRLDPQTPAQRAAASFAEAFVKSRGIDKLLAQIEPLYRAWDSLPPIEKAAKLLSGTGAQANPQLSPQQKVKAATDSIQDRFQDDIDTNLGPLYRVEKWLEGKLGRKLGFAEKASTVFSQLMGQEKTLAGSYLRDGVKTLVDGKWVTVGQSEAKILEGAKPEWLTPLFDGGPSKFDLWVTSRHIEGEAARREAEQVRAKLDPKVKVRAEVVPEGMRADYKAAADELGQDAEFKAWAEPAAERLTRAFKDTLHALEGNGIHALPVGTADMLHAKRPDYVPTERVLSDKSWNASTGSRGERGRAVIKERSGSGEQIVSPLVSYRKRLLLIASVQARQLKFNAMSKIAQQEGMGEYLLAGEAKLSQAGEVAFKRINDKLAELGIEGADVTQMMKDVGISNGEAMFLNEPWSNDPTKNTYWGIGEDGRPTNFRVADRALYELVTDQQVESHQLAKIVNGIANFSIGGVRPIKAMSDFVKLGATSANLAFHLRNIPRDAYTFLTNTIDRATIGQLPDALRRAFAFEFGVLKANLRGETFQSADKLFQLFHDARGDQLREQAFDRNAPQGASGVGGPKTQVGKAYYSVAGFLKDALNTLGAGELGPRFLEFKTRLKQLTGLDEAGLVKELDRAEKEAAAGREYVQPFDYAKILDSMDAAAEVTTPFNRQGILTRELNKIQPYFGPAIAGASKAVRNIRENPKGAAMGLAAIASLRVMHWLANKDEQWYEELSANDRYRNFVVQTPWGLRRIPAPRGLEVPVGGFLLPMLDKAAGKRPDVKGLVAATWDDLAPPKPLTPLGTVASEIALNQNWRGTPIVPGRDEHLSQIDKLTQYQGPYAVEQLTGGRGQLSLRGAGLVPFTEVQNARRSVDEFYQTYQELETARRSAQNRGERFTEEQRYLQFERAKKQIEDLSRQIRGDRLVGGKVMKGEPPAEERVKELREKQLQVARNLVFSPTNSR